MCLAGDPWCFMGSLGGGNPRRVVIRRPPGGILAVPCVKFVKREPKARNINILRPLQGCCSRVPKPKTQHPSLGTTPEAPRSRPKPTGSSLPIKEPPQKPPDPAQNTPSIFSLAPTPGGLGTTHGIPTVPCVKSLKRVYSMTANKRGGVLMRGGGYSDRFCGVC